MTSVHARFRVMGMAMVALAISQGVTAAQTRPNILVILVDDMGFSDLGFYGGEIKRN
ncbi:MAG: hypothetical protein GY809_21485 [Planctomycetes bacterium]|nr:hypothetical protein [Planctomycetota bacterium]